MLEISVIYTVSGCWFLQHCMGYIAFTSIIGFNDIIFSLFPDCSERTKALSKGSEVLSQKRTLRGTKFD